MSAVVVENRSEHGGPQPSSGLVVRALGEQEYAAWDRFVDTSPQGALFHSSAWMAASLLPGQIYGCFQNGVLRAGAPVYRNGSTVNPPPYTPYLGVVLPPPVGKYLTSLSRDKRLSRALAAQIRSLAASGSCRFSPSFVDAQPFIWENYEISVRYTYHLSLANLDAVWNGMEDARRNDIRKVQAAGVEVDPDAQFEDFLPLMRKTFGRQGQDIPGEAEARAYDKMLKAAGQRRCFLARDRSGAALAAAYVAWDKKTAYHLLGGYDPKIAHRGAGALALWAAIQHAGAAGLERFDFAGSTIPDVEAFVRGFGGTLVPTLMASWGTRDMGLRDALALSRKSVCRVARGIPSRVAAAMRARLSPGQRK